MRAILFGIPASHPTLAGQLMLDHKGVEYRRIDLVSGVHRPILRALGFPRNTVPAIRLDGARLQGTTEIALALDALLPREAAVPVGCGPAPRRRSGGGLGQRGPRARPAPARLERARARQVGDRDLSRRRAARNPSADRGSRGPPNRDARAALELCDGRERAA